MQKEVAARNVLHFVLNTAVQISHAGKAAMSTCMFSSSRRGQSRWTGINATSRFMQKVAAHNFSPFVMNTAVHFLHAEKVAMSTCTFSSSRKRSELLDWDKCHNWVINPRTTSAFRPEHGSVLTSTQKRRQCPRVCSHRRESGRSQLTGTSWRPTSRRRRRTRSSKGTPASTSCSSRFTPTRTRT
jgi:hypothetical protein